MVPAVDPRAVDPRAVPGRLRNGPRVSDARATVPVLPGLLLPGLLLPGVVLPGVVLPGAVLCCAHHARELPTWMTGPGSTRLTNDQVGFSGAAGSQLFAALHDDLAVLQAHVADGVVSISRAAVDARPSGP